MAAQLKLEVVTPTAKVYSEDVDMVTLPGAEGEMGIYPQHVPLLTQVAAGEVVARRDGRDHFFAIGEGFVEITAEHVVIMTDMAISAENIDEVRAEEARRRAEERLKEKLGPDEAILVSASLSQALAQLKVKRRHKT